MINETEIASWNWETFSEEISKGSFRISPSSPSTAIVQKLSAVRDRKQKITIRAITTNSSLTDGPKTPLGTVERNTKTLTLGNEFGTKITLYGFGSHTTTTYYSAQSERYETVLDIHSVKGEYNTGSKTAYTLEWILNWPDDIFMPHSSTTVTEQSVSRSIGAIQQKDKSTSKKLSKNCLNLNIDGYTISIFRLTDKEAPDTRRAFILYEGSPSKEVRQKLRDCISFFLGTYLLSLGSTSFNKEWGITEFEAFSAYDFGGKIFEYRDLPPTILSSKSKNEIDPYTFTIRVEGLYKVYDAIDFSFLSWAYWHAVVSPYHAAAVQYGAAIEALIKSIYMVKKEKLEAHIVEETVWRGLRDNLLTQIQQLNESNPNGYEILKNKINNLNELPVNQKSKQLFDSFGLKLGSLEAKAWNRRNESSHGRRENKGEGDKIIKDNKLLRIRFNRLLLALVENCDTYYDYYSIGHPLRRLSDGIEE